MEAKGLCSRLFGARKHSTSKEFINNQNVI